MGKSQGFLTRLINSLDSGKGILNRLNSRQAQNRLDLAYYPALYKSILLFIFYHLIYILNTFIIFIDNFTLLYGHKFIM